MLHDNVLHHAINLIDGSPPTYQPISDEEAGHRYTAATGAPPEETEAHVCLWRAIREDD
jgi:hypothetical protein